MAMSKLEIKTQNHFPWPMQTPKRGRANRAEQNFQRDFSTITVKKNGRRKISNHLKKKKKEPIHR